MTPSMVAPHPPTPRPPRPGTVRAAVYVQAGVVTLLLATVLAVAVLAVLRNDVITRAARTTGADPQIVSDERFGSGSAAVVVGGLSLGLALWFGILAIPLWRGFHPARILATIGAGAPALCVLCQGGSGLLLLPLALGAQEGAVSGGGPVDYGVPAVEDYDAFYAEVDRLSAGFRWVAIAAPAVALVVVGGIVALVTLLFMPSANRYFRPDGPRRAVQYVPVPYPVYWPLPVPPGAGAPGPGRQAGPEPPPSVPPPAPEPPPGQRS